MGDRKGKTMTKHEVLSKEAILAADDLPIVEHYVPEWGGLVWLRTLTGTERDHFEARIAQVTGTRGLRSRFVTTVVCKADGSQMFAHGDCDALEKKSASALHGIMEAGLKHNRMTADDIEDAEGNSESDPSEDSGTD